MASSTPSSLLSRRSPLAAPEAQRETLHQLKLPREFDAALEEAGLYPLRPTRLDIFQMNLGKMCNQTCRHCHVDAGPDRREVMSRETMEQCLAALAKTAIPTVDLTGGAPEMNPHFRWLVEEVRKLGRHVMDRCNLTILETAPHADLPEFFARHRVEVVCSLPHYRALNTDKQRGEGVYEKSIRALKRLNALGYGDGKSGLRLVLVTNPVGAFLPAGQASLEAEWKRELLKNHGIRFDTLFTITNMPISQFLEWLEQSGNLAAYLERLVTAFNPAAAAGVMCRNTLSVGWDGQLYDCDFNQMLEMPLAGRRRTLWDIHSFSELAREPILLADHCYGCTAGSGSSCSGSLT